MATKERPYFNLYAGDWLSEPKVKTLSFEEKGIYIDLLCHLWRYDEASLPFDDKFIAALLGLHGNKWKKLKTRFFVGELALFTIDNTVTPPRFFNKRLRKELEKIQKTSRKNSDNVTKGRWEKTKEPNRDGVGLDTTVLPDGYGGNTIQTQTQTQTQNIKEIGPKDPTPPKFNFRNALLELGVDSGLVSEWLSVRSKKRATNSETALKGLIREIRAAGITLDRAIEICVENSWSGFKAEYFFNLNSTRGPQHEAEGDFARKHSSKNWADGL